MDFHYGNGLAAEHTADLEQQKSAFTGRVSDSSSLYISFPLPAPSAVISVFLTAEFCIGLIMDPGHSWGLSVLVARVLRVST